MHALMEFTQSETEVLGQPLPPPVADAEVRRIQRRTERAFKLFVAAALLTLVLLFLAVALRTGQ